MNRITEWGPADAVSSPQTAPGAEAPADDPRLVRALEEYLAALEAGGQPQRDALLARHPDIAPALAECLDGLEMMQALTPPGTAPPPGEAPDLPAVPLGDYRLLREVGRGGMGIVYEAHQLSLGRRVALKVLPFAATLDPRQLQRFRNEAQAAAHLHHGHIVPVFAVGCARGVHYYAMQYIDGQNLASLLQELRHRAGVEGEPSAVADRAADTAPYPTPSLSTDYATGRPERFRAVARLGVQAAEALEYAHQMGVVHRDVKPANLLLDLHGNLWVTDFGLAQFRGHPGLTLTGDVLGTLRYMSPEQALARRVLLDHRTDVYSLGATLYELLTLRPALPGSDREELLRQIALQEPAAPRRLEPAVPRELETIVLKALAKNPEERYGTAQELADDLQRFLDDRPILARPPGLPQRLRKWGRRHRWPLGSLAVAAALLLVGATLGALHHAARQDALANEQARFARDKEQLRQETADKLVHSLLGRAAALRQARMPGYRDQVWADLHEAVRQGGTRANAGEVRAEVLACLGDPIGVVEPVPPVAFLRRGPPPPAPGLRKLQAAYDLGKLTTAVSPDGARLAVYGPCGNVLLWGKDGPTLLAEEPLRLGGIYDLQFTPDGRLLVAGCEEGVLVWSVPSLVPRWFVRGGPVLSVAVHPAGGLLASAGRQVELWSLASNRLVASFPLPHYGAGVAFSPDGKLLLAVAGGKVLAAWPMTDTPEKHYLAGHAGGVPGVAFSPDGRTLASVSKDRTLKLWDAGSGTLRHVCHGHAGAIEGLAFSPDGSLLATGDSQGVVCLWGPRSGKGVARVAGVTLAGQVWRLQFAASGKYLAAAGERGIAVWEVLAEDGAVRLQPFLTIPHAGAIDVALHPAGSELVFLDRTGGAYTAELRGDTAPRHLDLHARAEVRCLHFDAAGDRLTFLTPEGALALWDYGQGRVARTTVQKAFQLALRGRGGWVATSNPAHAVVVYDLGASREVVTLPPEASDVWSLAWSPDGTRVAVGLADGGLAIWDLEQVRARLAEFGIALDSPPGG